MTRALGMGMSVVFGAESAGTGTVAAAGAEVGVESAGRGGGCDRDVRRLRRKAGRAGRGLRDREADAEQGRGCHCEGGGEREPGAHASPLQHGRVSQRGQSPAERAAADRHLDESVGRCRQADRDRHPEREEGDPGQGDVEPGARHQEHGPVPEVDAVRALPDPDHRRRAEQSAGDGRGGVDGDEDDQRRDAREHEIPAAVERRVELADVDEAPQEHEQGREPDDVQRHRGPLPDPSSELPRRQQDRHAGADEQATRVCVGAVVDARRIPTGAVQQRHEERRHGGGAENRDGQLDPRRSPELQRQAQEQRPQQVELLLDRQRPQMLEHRLPPDGGEVRLLVEDQVPVRDVAERRDHATPQLRCFVGEEHDHVRRT